MKKLLIILAVVLGAFANTTAQDLILFQSYDYKVAAENEDDWSELKETSSIFAFNNDVMTVYLNDSKITYRRVAIVGLDTLESYHLIQEKYIDVSSGEMIYLDMLIPFDEEKNLILIKIYCPEEKVKNYVFFCFRV